MRKAFSLLLLILISCQKDEIILQPTPTVEFIFDKTESIVTDGQDISFEILEQNTYQLVLLSNNSVVTKETFESTVGIITRKIYTKILESKRYELILLKGSEQISQTFITVE